MNVIYSIVFWGNCPPRNILKQKTQNVSIAPTNQIFHTFTDKKKFWNSHQVLIHFKVTESFPSLKTKNFANSLTFGCFCFSENIYQVEHLSRSDFFSFCRTVCGKSPRKTLFYQKGTFLFPARDKTVFQHHLFQTWELRPKRNACAAGVSFPIAQR